MSLRTTLPAALALCLLACGGPSKSSIADLAVTNDFAAGVADLPPAACNQLPIPAAVDFQSNGAAAPAQTGGTIADGTYVITTATLYGITTDGGVGSIAIVVSIHGSVFQENSDIGDGATSATFTTSGSALTLVDTCPGTNGGTSFDYTATPNTLTLAKGAGSQATVLVLTKQ